MPGLRLVTFTELDAYVAACAPFDDSFMNFPIGTLLDSIDPRNATLLPRTDPSPRTLLAVYDGDQLIASLTKISAEFAWMLGTPRGIEESLTPEKLSNAVSLLVKGIADTTGPTSFDKAIGPRDLVNALIKGWVKYSTEHGQGIKAPDPFFASRVSYATRDSLPAPSPAFAQYRVEQATTAEDADVLVPLMLDFLAHGPGPVDEKRARLHVKVEMRQVWVCRVEGKIAGFGVVGRVTPRTIAIRNVYVSPAYRRKGIAEAIVRAMTRFYLGAEPLGFEGGPPEGPAEGIKQEVNLNVAEEAVERIYKRCGFLLDQDEPGAPGKKGWFHSVYRGVEYL